MDEIISLLEQRLKITNKIITTFIKYFNTIKSAVSFDIYYVSDYNTYILNHKMPDIPTDIEDILEYYDSIKIQDIAISFIEYIIKNDNFINLVKFTKVRTDTFIIELEEDNKYIEKLLDEYYNKVPVIDTKIIEKSIDIHKFKKLVDDRISKNNEPMINKFITHFISIHHDEYYEFIQKMKHNSLLNSYDIKRLDLSSYSFPYNILSKYNLVPVTKFTSCKFLLTSINIKYDESVSHECNFQRLADDNTIGIILIKTTGYDVEYSSRSITDRKYMTKKGYNNIYWKTGLNNKYLEMFDTVSQHDSNEPTSDEIKIINKESTQFLVIRQHNKSYRFLHNNAFELDININNLLIPVNKLDELINNPTLIQPMKQLIMEEQIIKNYKNKQYEKLITNYKNYTFDDEVIKLGLLKSRILENWKHKMKTIKWNNIDELFNNITDINVIIDVVIDAYEKTFTDFRLDISLLSMDNTIAFEYLRLSKVQLNEHKKDFINIHGKYINIQEQYDRVTELILNVQEKVINLCIKNDVFISNDISLLKYSLFNIS